MSLVQVQWQIDRLSKGIQGLHREITTLKGQIDILTNYRIDTSALANVQSTLMAAMQSVQTQRSILCGSPEYKAEMMESYGTIPEEVEHIRNAESMSTEEVIDALNGISVPAPPGGWSRRSALHT